jgi:hypothetical protein
MAFSADQQARIRWYLGYGGLEDNGDLQRSMDGVGGIVASVALIDAQLTLCATVDTELLKVFATVLAVQDGSIHLRAAHQLGVVRSMGRQAVGRIAAHLKVPIAHDVFSGSGPVLPADGGAGVPGDGWYPPGTC